MFKKNFVLVFILSLFFVSNIYAQSTSVSTDEEIKPKDAYMMEDIKKYLTEEENNYFMAAQAKMEDFISNNKDLEKYMNSAIQGMLKGDKKSIEEMFIKLKKEIEALIVRLNTLNPPASLKRYHELNVEALDLLVKKLDPNTIMNQDAQKKLDIQGEQIVKETNQEIDNLIKARQ